MEQKNGIPGTDNPRFWEFLDQLAEQHPIVIDRPKNTFHPEHPDIFYEMDYGYLDGTESPDGEAIDVWVGTAPERRIVGVICTVDLVKRDAEMKLLFGCTGEEMEYIDRFYNIRKTHQALLVRRRTFPGD